MKSFGGRSLTVLALTSLLTMQVTASDCTDSKVSDVDSQRARQFADVHNFRTRNGSQSSLIKKTAGSLALQNGQDKSLEVFEDRIGCIEGSGRACYDSIGTTEQVIPAIIKKTETETHVEHEKCQKDYTDIKGSKKQTYCLKGNLGKTCYDWGMMLDCDDNGIAGYGCDT
jgi:hypothetical protein